MFEASEYELLDFGAGRKLERFGPVVLDRSAPAAADFKPAEPERWTDAAARFEISDQRTGQPSSGRGRWIMPRPLPSTWTIRHHELKFQLKLTNFGHVGLFPEQASNWDWLSQQVRSAAQTQSGQPLRVLNLFAYTGGSTLAAAGAGAEVAHVDAARNIVAWARRNAELSELTAAPIRWIVDDAVKFAHRELKRGKHYDGVILDPPSYGHGAKGETWQLDHHLPEMLSVCRALTAPQPRFVLLTCHAPQYSPQRLADCLVAADLARQVQDVQFGDLSLRTADGRQLHAGVFARTVQNL